MKSTEQIARARLAPEPSDLASLVAGEHHNPHGILGAHEYGDHTIIRAFRPHATSMVALVGADRFPLQHIDSGLFAAAKATPGTTGTPRAATASFVRVLSIVSRLLAASHPA